MISYRIFESFLNLIAFSTEKGDGFTNHARFTGDHPEIFLPNRQILASKIGLMPQQLVFPRQTHSDHISIIRAIPTSELSDTDALISDQPGICLCVQTADCVPVLLFDPVRCVIGVIHAGWQGTAKKIIEKAIRKMEQYYSSDPKHLLAAIGPSIGPDNYEVGPEVVSAFHVDFNDKQAFLTLKKNGKSLLDLWEANRLLLIGSGIIPGNIEIVRRCSYLEKESFYSARREGQQTGRIATGICLKTCS